MDSTRVSVTWEPPLFPNGPILSYVVNLSHPDFNLIKVSLLMIRHHFQSLIVSRGSGYVKERVVNI